MGSLSVKARLALLIALLLGLMAVLGLVALLQLPAAQAASQIAAAQAEVAQLWAAYKNTVLVEEEQHLIARAEPQLSYLAVVLRQLDAQLQAGSAPTQLRRFAGEELRAALEPLGATLSELTDVQLSVARREADAGRADFERARWHLLLLMGGSGGLAAALACWVWSRHHREQQQAEAGERRVQQFYIALSQCNQLIVRDPASALQLYQGLCRICVDTGHAMVAEVMLREDGHIGRVAVHGEHARLLAGEPERWPLDSPYDALAMSGQVLRSGEHWLSNDAALDPRLTHWHASVVARGARAMAAFPLRRGGQPCGALVLFAAEPGFFDPALVRLLDEMAGDVSFALDNLDREQARQRALQEAEAERELFRRLFNASSVSAALTRLTDGRILEVNELLCRRYGYAREQLLGLRMADLDVGMDAADRSRYYEQLRLRGRVNNMAVSGRGRDGARLHSLVSGEIIDYQGQPCVLSTSVDISELRAAQQAAEQRSAAEAANHAKTEFLAQMSHELRTPLNAILGFTQLLEVDARMPLHATQRGWLAHIHDAGRHLLALINDVLDISGIEAGRLTLNTEPVALRGLLDEALALTQGAAAPRRVELRPLYLAQPECWARVDRRRLQQVLINLLANAVKYNRPGGMVSLGLAAADERVLVTVADTGLGMDEAQRAQLFQPFNRLGREQGDEEGSGIGLALSQRLVLAMDGQIEVQSRPGEGTRITLSLPAATALSGENA